MHNLKLMQELTFAVNIECLQSNLLVKLLMHNCARAKHSKTCKYSIQRIFKINRAEK